MIILGAILLVVGLVLKISILWYIGIALIVVGAVLFILGSMGRRIGGRRHYW
jgi:VIT1/CCC1 family predicted Fe2+/Mn2+ transporter